MKRIVLILTLLVSYATAKTMDFPDTIIPSAPSLKAKAHLLMNVNNGDIISEANSHDRIPPASLTKMMTLYLIEDMINKDQIKLTDEVNIDHVAYQAEGSSMFLELNSRITVDELINGVIIVSGNDAALALANYAAGSVDAFVELMNQQAQQWGLTETHFTNPTGIPNQEHYSSAYDLAIMAKHIIEDHPHFYDRYQQTEMTHNNITQKNRNRLLHKLEFVDGLKTGHTQEAGYCLVSSGKQRNMRLIAVTLGSPTDKSRDIDNEKLITYGFKFFDNLTLFDEEVATIPVWKGLQNKVALKTRHPVNITIPYGSTEAVSISVQHASSIDAPYKAGTISGKASVFFKHHELGTYDLVTNQHLQEAGFFGKIRSQIAKLFS